MASFTRLMSAHEIREAFELLREDFWRDIEQQVEDLEQHCDKLQAQGQVWAYQQDGETLGIIAFYANDRTTSCAFLSSLVVKKAARGAHIGSSLLSKCKELCKNENMQWLRLKCARDNLHAQRIYLAKGFEVELMETDEITMITEL